MSQVNVILIIGQFFINGNLHWQICICMFIYLETYLLQVACQEIVKKILVDPQNMNLCSEKLMYVRFLSAQ